MSLRFFLPGRNRAEHGRRVGECVVRAVRVGTQGEAGVLVAEPRRDHHRGDVDGMFTRGELRAWRIGERVKLSRQEVLEYLLRAQGWVPAGQNPGSL